MSNKDQFNFEIEGQIDDLLQVGKDLKPYRDVSVSLPDYPDAQTDSFFGLDAHDITDKIIVQVAVAFLTSLGKYLWGLARQRKAKLKVTKASGEALEITENTEENSVTAFFIARVEDHAVGTDKVSVIKLDAQGNRIK